MSRRASRAAAATAVLALIATAGPVSAAAASAGRVERVVRDPAISEASALVASRRHPALLWTLNDSGNPAQLFGVGPDGSTVSTVQVAARNVDWEALAPVTAPDGTPLLAIGDIGDNAASRPFVDILMVDEPARLPARQRLAPRLTLRLRYPHDPGPQDAETLLADPRDGRLFVLTKGLFGAWLLAVPSTLWPGGGLPDRPTTRSATMTLLAQVPLSLATDGAVLPDGQPVVRSYSELVRLPPLPTGTADQGAGESRVLAATAATSAPAQQQGEGLALLADGRVLLGSEGVRQPVLRVTLPAAAPASATASAPAGLPTSGAAGPQASDPPRSGAPWPWAAPGWWVGAGVVAGAAGVLAAALGRRRRGRR